MYGESIDASPRLSRSSRRGVTSNLQNGIIRSSSRFIMISFAKSLDENQTINMAKYLSTLKQR